MLLVWGNLDQPYLFEHSKEEQHSFLWLVLLLNVMCIAFRAPTLAAALHAVGVQQLVQRAQDVGAQLRRTAGLLL